MHSGLGQRQKRKSPAARLASDLSQHQHSNSSFGAPIGSSTRGGTEMFNQRGLVHSNTTTSAFRNLNQQPAKGHRAGQNMSSTLGSKKGQGAHAGHQLSVSNTQGTNKTLNMNSGGKRASFKNSVKSPTQTDIKITSNLTDAWQGLQPSATVGPSKTSYISNISNQSQPGTNLNVANVNQARRSNDNQSSNRNKKGSLTYRIQNRSSQQYQNQVQQNFISAQNAVGMRDRNVVTHKGAVSSRERFDKLNNEGVNMLGEGKGTLSDLQKINRGSTFQAQNSLVVPPDSQNMQSKINYNRNTTSDQPGSPSRALNAQKQSTVLSSASLPFQHNQASRFSQSNSSQLYNLKSSTQSTNSVLGAKRRLSPKNPQVGSQGLLGGNHHLRQEFMEIEQNNDMPDITLSDVLLKLMRVDKDREMQSSEQVILSDLGKKVDDAMIYECPSDLRNQRVIKADAERTRIFEIKSIWKSQNDDSKAHEEVIRAIEKVLTFYTKNSNTTYKQGYNELLGPWLWMALAQEDSTHSVSNYDTFFLDNPLTMSYHALSLFVKNFMPTLFLEEDFICLQSCFCLMRLLLKYHDPEICQVLSSAGVTPELYATGWFFTYFSNKCTKIELACELWRQVIELKNNKLIFFLAIGLIAHNREAIKTCGSADLPGRMADLRISSFNDLNAIVHLALTLQRSTPISFFESQEMNALFGENSQQYFRKMTMDQKMQLHLRLEQMQCLPITTSEFFSNIYPSRFSCANPKCALFREIARQKSEARLTELDHNQMADAASSLQGIEGILLPRQIHEHICVLASQKASGKSHRMPKMSQTTFSPSKMKGSFELRSKKQVSSPIQYKDVQQNVALVNAGKSPFKTLVKQQPIEADASVVPMETETNVRDDDSDSQPQQKLTNTFLVTNQEAGRQKQLGIQNTAELQMGRGRALSEVYALHPKFEEGPAHVNLCEECKHREMHGRRSNNSNPSKIRLVVIDCRLAMLQKETMLPRTAKLEIHNDCDKRYLQQQVRQLIGDCRDGDHICLLGLSEQEAPKDYNQAQEMGFGYSPISKGVNDRSNDIREHHERVLQCVIEIFYKERTKYISFLPGGFEECHRFISQQNMNILSDKNLDDEDCFLQFIEPHEPFNCYHCAHSLDSDPQASNFTQSMVQLHQDFEVIGNMSPRNLNFEMKQSHLNADLFGQKYQSNRYQLSSNVQAKEESKQGGDNQPFDIFQGFRHWWQDNVQNYQRLVGGLGLADLELQNRGSSSSGQNAPPYLVDNNGQQQLLMNVTQQTRKDIEIKQKLHSGPKEKEVSNPAARLQGASLFGNELPPDRQRRNVAGQNYTMNPFTQNQSFGLGAAYGQKSTNQLENHLSVIHKNKTLNRPSVNNSTSLQCAGESSTTLAQLPELQSRQQVSRGRSKPRAPGGNAFVYADHKQSPLHQYYQGVELNPNSGSPPGILAHKKLRNLADQSEQDSVHSPTLLMESAGSQASKEDREGNQLQQPQEEGKSQTTNQPQTGKDLPTACEAVLSSAGQPLSPSEQRETEEEKVATSEQPLHMKGEGSDTRESSSRLNTKSTSSASQQLQLEERSYYLCNGIQQQQSYSGQEYKVKKIIDTDAKATPNDIVIYHVKRLASSHLQQVILQQQLGEDESKPAEQTGLAPVYGSTDQSASVVSIIITQYTTICLSQAQSSIQSRFFMHDLIKITSRKNSSKIITFYFRIPQFGEYNQKYFAGLEKPLEPSGAADQFNVILDTYNQNPKVQYQFAYKRTKYREVKLGFEFKSEDEAKDCIERVSILYKRLKENRSRTTADTRDEAKR